MGMERAELRLVREADASEDEIKQNRLDFESVARVEPERLRSELRVCIDLHLSELLWPTWSGGRRGTDIMVGRV